MSPRRTRRGTIRENAVEISINTSYKSSSKTLRSFSRANKSQTAKNSEEDSDSPVKINKSIDNISTNLLNNTSINTKKRKKKLQEIKVNQDSVLSVTIDEPKNKSRIYKNNSKTSKLKKKIENNSSQIINFNSLISEDESIDIKNEKDGKQISYTIDNLISEDEEMLESPSKKIKFNNKSVSSKKVLETPQKLPTQKVSLNNGKSQQDITPKSSPLNVSFTPHRSTKTPRKSPVNLGSPKTHSRNSLKLLNVPRKLSITQTPPSDQSNNSFQQQSDFTNKGDESFKSNSSKSHKRSKSSSSKKNSVPSILKTMPRFSKSPKIVFRTPKSKTTKKSPVKKVSATKHKSLSKSKSQMEINKSSKTDSSLTPDKVDKNNSLKKNDLSVVINTSLKADSLLESSITKKSSNASFTKAEKLLKKNSPVKSKKSPKLISPLISKKMPKIVLTPKPKRTLSKVLKSPTPSKIKKLSGISPSKALAVITSLSLKNSIVANDLTFDSSMSPRVVVNKLTSPDLTKSTLSAKKNQPSVHLVPIDHINASARAKQQSIYSSTSESKKSLRNSTQTEFRINTSINSNNLSIKNTPTDILEKKLLSLRPSNTSTPREKVKRTQNLVSNKKILSPNQIIESISLSISNTKSKVIRRLNNESKTDVNHPLIEDESVPLMNDSSLIHMSDVFDSEISQKDNIFDISTIDSAKKKSKRNSSISLKDHKNNTFEITKNTSNPSFKDELAKDNTYELENPKTPRIQKKTNKQTSDKAESNENEEQDSKKNFRVHFASPNLENQVHSLGINRVGTPGHAIQQKTPSSVSKRKTTPTQLFTNKSTPNTNSKTKSQSRTLLNTPLNKGRSSSVSVGTFSGRKSINSTQLASVNRLSKPRIIADTKNKLEIRTPKSKKAPNFVEIHQKNFAKMESLVDLRKRIKDRHIHLNTATPNPKTIPPKSQSGNSKPLPPNSSSVYNRFGFKLRKNDAVDIISKKQICSVDSREKKRENARSTLKGVRMNRRFELQMKCRTKKT